MALYRRHSQTSQHHLAGAEHGGGHGFTHSLSLVVRRFSGEFLRRGSLTDHSGHKSPHKHHKRASSTSSGNGLQPGLEVTKFFARHYDADEEAQLESEVAAFAARVAETTVAGRCCGASGRPTVENNRVLLPTSPFLKVWTIVLFVLIGWTALVTPFQVRGIAPWFAR